MKAGGRDKYFFRKAFANEMPVLTEVRKIIMKEQVQQRIIENLQHLNLSQLSNALDFIEFLRYKRKSILPETSVSDSLGGNIFVRGKQKKQDIALLPKRKMGKIKVGLSREDIYENER